MIIRIMEKIIGNRVRKMEERKGGNRKKLLVELEEVRDKQDDMQCRGEIKRK